MKLKATTAAMLLVLASLPMQQALAAEKTFLVTGTIVPQFIMGNDGSGRPIPELIPVGTKFTGSFTIDDAISPNAADGSWPIFVSSTISAGTLTVSTVGGQLDAYNGSTEMSLSAGSYDFYTPGTVSTNLSGWHAPLVSFNFNSALWNYPPYTFPRIEELWDLNNGTTTASFGLFLFYASPIVSPYTNVSLIVKANITSIVSTVPEPSHVGMLAAGLALTGFALRRRKA